MTNGVYVLSYPIETKKSQKERTNALLGKFFEPFIFEEVPANEFPVSHVYLKEVELCDIYLGLYGNLEYLQFERPPQLIDYYFR